MAKQYATTDCVQALLQTHRYVIGMDEVGRGAIAGPLTVGCAIVTDTAGAPSGLADSKLLSARQRSALQPAICNWVAASAVGHVQARTIDRLGLSAALQLAAFRALSYATGALGAPREVAQQSAIIIDGRVNWCKAPPTLDAPPLDAGVAEFLTHATWRTEIGADRSCAVVAAASIVAKNARDQLMSDLPDAGYGYSAHKGYGAPAHLAAIATLGVSHQHRRSFKSCRDGR